MNNYPDVRQFAYILLKSKEKHDAYSFTSEEIRSAVMSAISTLGSRVEPERLIADLEASFQTRIGQERILRSDENWRPWLGDRKAEIDWRFWDRYRLYLSLENSWAQATIDRLDRTTDIILGSLTDPVEEQQFDRRGMVVGHVQSGKTSNYTGLICKAADAGYRVIVVLTGFHNSLRTQTQIRLEEGFLGYSPGATYSNDWSSVPPVGVGDVARYGSAPSVNAVTTRDYDFRIAAARHFAVHPDSNPLLFVIKKNASVLRNLLGWVNLVASHVDEHGRSFVKNVPLLVIDDEADQGSIDTKSGALDDSGDVDPEHEPTVLNKYIRTLLHRFEKSAYVGYTATPFANIFIHELPETPSEGKDLFPSSFIVSLPTPSNYVGPVEVFGLGSDEEGESTVALPIVREVSDHADTLRLREKNGWVPPVHRSTHVPRYKGEDTVPPSLRTAIASFVLACAARAARGDSTAHNSMLVHVTRLTAVQAQVAEQVESELINLQRRIRFGDGDSSSQAQEELRELWEKDFLPTTAKLHSIDHALDCQPLMWEEVNPYILQAASSIAVKTVNGLAGDVLEYVSNAGTGLNVIAVGGDKLSRGLTLEGLSISYFTRTSRMYDTLMQMGRWFGYRPRYLDLCRLYTTPDLRDWYTHIAEASQELREDFDIMAASGQTPKEFGHRVRSHPSLMVTSDVKMRHGTELQVSFAGTLSQTIDFYRDRPSLSLNWQSANDLVGAIERGGSTPEPYPDTKSLDRNGYSRWRWCDVDSSLVMGFLASYREHDTSRRVRTRLLADYILQENRKGRLRNWTILLGSGEAGTIVEPATVQVGQFAVSRLVKRVFKADEGLERNRLISENHYRIGVLSSPSDLEAAQNPTDGLMVLYPLWWEPVEERKVEPSAAGVPILGFAIKFPRALHDGATVVRYIVNNIYNREIYAE